MGVYLKVPARVADGTGGWGRAREGLRVRVAVLHSPPGPGRLGGGGVAEPWKGEEQECLWLSLEAGLGCCRGKNS